MAKRNAQTKNVVDAKRACASSALNFSQLPLVQSAVESTTIIEYPSVTALPKTDETSIEFQIDKTDGYTDLSRAMLYMQVQITYANGDLVGGEDYCTVINNIGYALFDSVDLYISDQQVTKRESAYAYWTYIYNLLFYDEAATRLYLKTGNLWYLDTPNQFNNTDISLGFEEPVNAGFRSRHSTCGDSHKFWLCNRLLLNTEISRLLPSQTEITLKFNRAPTNFCLQSSELRNYRIKIWDARLQVNRVKLFDYAHRDYERLLNTTGFFYPGTNPVVRAKTVSKGDQNVDWTPFTGKLPQRIYIWMTDQKAYNGALNANPLNFHHFGVNRIQVYKNGQALPGAQGLGMLRGAGTLSYYMHSAAAINNPETFKLSLSEYRGGYFIVVVDISSDFSAGCDYDNIDELGSLRIILDYREPLEDAITLFCMGEVQETLKIDGKRNPSFIE